MPRADDLLARARLAASSGNYVRALRYLEQASQGTGPAHVAARVEITRAYIEAETGDPAGAVRRCELVLEQPGLDPVTEGKAWQQLGLIRMRTGETDRAMEALARAVSILPPGSEDRGYALINRGNVHLQHNRARLAAADFAAARDELDRPGLELDRAKAEHNLGYSQLLLGDLVGAMSMITDAADVLSASSPINRATLEQDRAEILTAAGRPREASTALQKAAAAYGARRLRTFQAECELTLAWTLLRQDPAKARVVARRAARRFRGQASPSRALQADAAAVVAEISAGGRTATLLQRADALVSDLKRLGFQHDAALVELQGVRVAVARGDLESARDRLAAVRIGSSSPVTTRLLWREVRAELAQARGDERRARDHVRAGLDDLHAWQSSFGSLDLQSTLVGHGRSLARHGLALALAQGDPALVFEWSERARALVGRVSPVRPPADEQVASDLTELRLLQVAAAGGQPDRRTPEGRRAEELRQRVRQRRWYGAGAGVVDEPVGLAQLQSALGQDDAAMVAHLVVGGRVAALVVTSDGARVLDLAPSADLRDRLDGLTSDLTMAAAHRSGPLAEQVRASLRRRLDRVAGELVAPLLPHLGDRRVVLTPSGSLAGTPWTLLPGFLGRPLTIPTSASRWHDLRQWQLLGTGRVGLVAGPGVARGPEEVSRAADAWVGAQVLCDDAATAPRVAELAAEVDVLHLAGHGRHTGENPLFSAVELADGPWFGYDIDLLPRAPSTVVLSACELGRVTVRSGEEAIGMSAAWLHAGARTVLSSPVLIADDVACDAMGRWHALVAGGRAPADALAEVCAGADDVVPMLSFGVGW
jgi:tetratricopeptide (TPR) repeat protein